MRGVILCDICGKQIREHAKQAYTIRKKFWEIEIFGSKIDLCEDCYNEMEKYITEKINAKNPKNDKWWACDEFD